MSHQIRSLDGNDTLDLESGLEALQSSPEFDGPVEPLDGHDSNGHLALIYESREEQFTTVVPFVRQGLERGERCLYIVDENDEEELLAALRAGGVDVNAALESDALTLHSPEETYCRDGGFDPDEMIGFLEEAIESVREEYEGLRVVGEMTWILGDDTPLEALIDYEVKLNRLFPSEDCIALCQYNRERFPAELLVDIIKTHPHLIYDNTVCQNFYYIPPEEFSDPGRSEREVDRMMGTLLERTEAKTALQERERYLHQQNEIIASPDQSFEEKLQALFELGCERFDLELGAMARVDPEADRFEIEYTSGEHEHFEPGLELPLSETYCAASTDSRAVVGISDPYGDGYESVTVHREFGLKAYLGTFIEVNGGLDRTFFFVSSEPRDGRFSDEEITFLRLMGQWVKYELERQQHERYLQAAYEITSDSEQSFDEKVEALLELGRERFELEVGCLTYLPSWDGEFRVEAAVTPDGEPSRGSLSVQPRPGCYCHRAIEADGPVDETDVRKRGWEDDPVFEEFGLTSYFGTAVTAGSEPYGTLWFGDTSARETDFTEAERTFLELMGQWVSYELERKEHNRYQRTLYEITARSDLTFEEKLGRLLEFGRDRFEVDIGFLARIEDDSFEVVDAVGSHELIQPGSTDSLEGTYCRKVLGSSETVSVVNAPAEGWEDDPAYGTYDLDCYIGAQVDVQNEVYGTLCFADVEPRNHTFTGAERTFLELMAQWVSYELERAHHEAQLAALNEMSRDLMAAETPREVADRCIEHAEASLQLPSTAIMLYDETMGELSLAARTARATDDLPTSVLCERGSGPLWEAFVANETRIVEGNDSDGIVGVPLGNRGLFIAATGASGGIDVAERDFIEATARTVTAACVRADRERLLQEREETLEEQNQTLERLNRINDIIRSIDQALVQASTRAEIETVVCEQLADVGPYELAWIGEHDSFAGKVTPCEWAGAERGYLDGIAITTDDSPEGRGPVGRAVKTREPQVVNDVLDDRSFEPWRQAAFNRGYHATIALPLVYEDTLYGVLSVYANQPQVFDDLERTVLTELSDTIAYAMNAVESKKALVSNEMTELELTIPVSGTELELQPTGAADEDGRELSLEMEKIVPQTDGGFRGFFTVRGTCVEDIQAFASQLPIDDPTVISEHEEGGEPVKLFEGELCEGSICSTVLEHGGRPHRFTVTDSMATVVVDLAADADIREFVETFRTKYPGSELVAQRTQERSRRTLAELHATLTDDLTPRQREALQIAYFSGYFDRTRARTASEIAETMGITQPTFNTHIRAAHRKLCRLLFDVEPSDPCDDGHG